MFIYPGKIFPASFAILFASNLILARCGFYLIIFWKPPHTRSRLPPAPQQFPSEGMALIKVSSFAFGTLIFFFFFFHRTPDALAPSWLALVCPWGNNITVFFLFFFNDLASAPEIPQCKISMRPLVRSKAYDVMQPLSKFWSTWKSFCNHMNGNTNVSPVFFCLCYEVYFISKLKKKKKNEFTVLNHHSLLFHGHFAVRVVLWNFPLAHIKG